MEQGQRLRQGFDGAVKGIGGFVKGFVNQGTEAQQLVKKAVNPNVKWGPHTEDMQTLAELSFRPGELIEVVTTLFERLRNAKSKYGTLISMHT
ncbi:hypothetical protein KIPB_013113 [Kipferlia bialata]|uniref:ENTH domain-containing protein n=1 Tax=Kipferlia bialata TaxID=797122 RepID=A0A391P120_9EUKA|nr:hypothetical protein KIPB_013113 [Kipferlia bialata]|eukprot:g13113.t1